MGRGGGGRERDALARLDHVREVRNEAPVVLNSAARRLNCEGVRVAAFDARAQLPAELVRALAVAVLVDAPHVLAANVK